MHTKGIVKKQIKNGIALDRFRQIVKMQGGNTWIADDPKNLLPKAKKSIKIRCKKTGYISTIGTRDIDIKEMLTGAWLWERKEYNIDNSAGEFYFTKKTNDYTAEVETISELLYNSTKNIKEAVTIILCRIHNIIYESKDEHKKLIKEVLWTMRDIKKM